ncbi:MAG TPA: glucokinase, partial [Vineibacter sp.]|nr:glucokinase [Vineibacter sp.]
MTRYLLADIGGTNARFALYDHDVIGPIDVQAVADHPRAGDAIAAFIGRNQSAGPIEAAAIGVAGPVDNGRCTFTNSDWVVDAAELRAAFGWRHVDVINDFEATALAIPHLQPADLFTVGGGQARTAPCVV